MNQIVTRSMSQKWKLSRESVSDNHMETILRALNSALESFMTSTNKRMDGIIADYVKELTMLKGELAKQNSDQASNLCEIQNSVERAHASIE